MHWAWAFGGLYEVCMNLECSGGSFFSCSFGVLTTLVEGIIEYPSAVAG